MRNKPNTLPVPGARAFTLVEMLLATAILCLLMTGILALVADFAASKQQLATRRPAAMDVASTDVAPAAIARWTSLLREDLLLSQSVDLTHANEVRITGYCALDDHAERRNVPVQVTYAIEMAGSLPYVVRRQVALGKSLSTRNSRELVMTGVRQFALSRDGGTVAPSTAPAKVAEALAITWVLHVWDQHSESPRTERFLQVGGAL